MTTEPRRWFARLFAWLVKTHATFHTAGDR